MINISIPLSAILVQQAQLEVRGMTAGTLVDRKDLISLGIQGNKSEAQCGTGTSERLVVASCFQTISCMGKTHQGNPEDPEIGS